MSNKIKFNILKHAGDPVQYPAGSTIFKNGEPGDTMFVVKEGTVDIIVNGTTIDQMEPGDLFGEMSLIDQRLRSADAIAGQDCSLAVIDEKRFLYMTDHTPRFALQVMRLVAERLRERMADLDELRSGG